MSGPFRVGERFLAGGIRPEQNGRRARGVGFFPPPPPPGGGTPRASRACQAAARTFGVDASRTGPDILMKEGVPGRTKKRGEIQARTDSARGRLRACPVTAAVRHRRANRTAGPAPAGQLDRYQFSIRKRAPILGPNLTEFQPGRRAQPVTRADSTASNASGTGEPASGARSPLLYASTDLMRVFELGPSAGAATGSWGRGAPWQWRFVAADPGVRGRICHGAVEGRCSPCSRRR